MFKQLGNTTVAAAGVAGVLGVGGIVGSQYYEDQRVPQQYAETAKREVRAIQKASNQYRMEYGAWPSSIAELKASPHYNGVEVSPYGSEYEFTIDGDVFTIGLEAASARHAAQLTGELQTETLNTERFSFPAISLKVTLMSTVTISITSTCLTRKMLNLSSSRLIAGKLKRSVLSRNC